MGRMRVLAAAGNDINDERTFQLFLDWSAWLVGLQWERHRSEAQVTVHAGPLHALWWWRR